MVGDLGVRTAGASRHMSYHAAAELLQQAGALGAAEARRRAPRADGLHRRRQQERHARRRVRHRTALDIASLH